MDQKVKYYLDIKKEEYKIVKEKNLIQLGLCNKVYSPDNKKSKEYRFQEWDKSTGKANYYKLVAVDVTDEEYEEILKYSKVKIKRKANPIANIMTVISCLIFLVGFLRGFTCGNGMLALIYWGIAFVSGISFYAIAEIINLLTDIKNK